MIGNIVSQCPICHRHFSSGDERGGPCPSCAPLLDSLVLNHSVYDPPKLTRWQCPEHPGQEQVVSQICGSHGCFVERECPVCHRTGTSNI